MKVYKSPRDNALIFIPVMIFSIGLFFIYSASWREGRPLDESLVTRQSLWMLFAIGLSLASLKLHYRHLLDYAWAFYGITLVLLVIVLFMPGRMGARRWIDLGFFSFQPSELAKFSVILVLAAFMKEVKYAQGGHSKWWIPFLITAVPVILIMKEPDLGTSLVFIPILFSMLYLWGFNMKWVALLIGLVAIASPFLYHGLHDYQKNRILTFLNPSHDPLGAGYTIIQSKIAIGSGGLFGKGFLSGSQNQLHFLPENHTDFIFAVIGEEGGFIATAAVVIGYWIIIYKGFRIAQKCHNPFGKFLAMGITTQLAFQALVNMLMTTGLLPVVGMPLMLVSYGGSSLVITMLLIGVLINIGMRRDPFI